MPPPPHHMLGKNGHGMPPPPPEMVKIAEDDEIRQIFADHMAKYQKSYGTTEEHEFRLQIFRHNLMIVQWHNQHDGASFQMGMNQFSTWTPQEYHQLLGYRPKNQHKPPMGHQPNHRMGFRHRKLEVQDLPAKLDWRDNGAVTPIKNQGQCGSCWAFSATGGMEGAYVQAGNNLTSFSEQQLVDCSHNGPDKDDHNDGCNGGDMDLAFQWAMNNTMVTEKSYPYDAVDGKCKMGSASSLVDIAKVGNYTDIESADPLALATALTHGPVSIAVNAAAVGW
jgi:hypothetical protein